MLLLALNMGNFDIVYHVVDTGVAMSAALQRQNWDVITSDHAIPLFSAPAALTLAKSLRPDVPFIIVSGEIDLNLAVSLMQAGARDFVQKRELARLVAVIERELHEVELSREHKMAEHALHISEARYRRLFETAQDGILILDAGTGEIIDVNPFLMDMLGYAKEQLLGRKLWEIGHFKDVEAAKAAFDQLSDTGYIRYENLPLESIDGRRLEVEFVCNVYLVDDVKVAQCNIRDITVHKRTESELRKLNLELDQRVRARTIQLEIFNQDLDSFSSSVSHDLRAPLRRISGFVEALWEGYTDKQSDESLHLMERIRSSVVRMNDLVDALLELAQLFSGVKKCLTVDLSALARQIACELRQTQPDRQVEFVIAEGITTCGDPQLMRIVLENLLSNAWKFTAPIDLVRIEFDALVQANGSVAFFVRDNGVGFDMTYVSKLFGPFQRLHSDKVFPGTGIGLATVQRIIHRHFGRVWAQGEVNKGATFYFTIGRKS
jgi:PAS domain S-box-containing protein